MVFPPRKHLPDINGPAAPGGRFALFGGKLFRQKAMLFLVVSEDCETARVARRGEQPLPEKRFPEVRIIEDVTDAPLLPDVRDHPVESDPIALILPVFCERPLQRGDADALAREQNHGVKAFPAELKDDVGRPAPAGVHKTPLDVKLGAVLPPPDTGKIIVGQILERSAKRRLESGTGMQCGIGRAGVGKGEVTAPLVRERAIIDDPTGEVFGKRADHPVKQILLHVNMVRRSAAAGTSPRGRLFILSHTCWTVIFSFSPESSGIGSFWYSE